MTVCVAAEKRSLNPSLDSDSVSQIMSNPEEENAIGARKPGVQSMLSWGR